MFFMKKESAQQGLDINVGRVLEMFQTGVLDPAQTSEALMKFFTGEAQKDLPGLNSALAAALEALDKGQVTPSRTRAALVDAAGASERHEPNYADILHQLLEPAPVK